MKLSTFIFWILILLNFASILKYGQIIAKVGNPAFDSKVDDDFENRSQIIATTTNDGRHENIWAQDDMRQICRLLNIFCVLTVKYVEKKKKLRVIDSNTKQFFTNLWLIRFSQFSCDIIIIFFTLPILQKVR